MRLYLSRLVLNPRHRDAARHIAFPYELHRTLHRAFHRRESGGPGRILFRVEPQDASPNQPGRIVLVQSGVTPEWADMVSQLKGEFLHGPPESRELPQHFEDGMHLRFRLRANPTVRRVNLPDGATDTRKNRPRNALYKDEDQIQWLVQKGEVGGFRLLRSASVDWFQSDSVCSIYDLRTRKEGTLNTGKKLERGQSQHFSVLYEGRLEITDSQRFVETLAQGVGPAKAFGFGLLSVAKG